MQVEGEVAQFLNEHFVFRGVSAKGSRTSEAQTYTMWDNVTHGGMIFPSVSDVFIILVFKVRT